MPEQAVDRRAAELAGRYAGGPTVAQWRRLLDGPAGSAITVINFFKLRPIAHTAAGETSGMQAMMQYAAVSGPTLARVGGRFLVTGAFDTTLIGEDEQWDLVAIATYPDRAALLALFDDDAYRAAWADRVAAVERQRVVIAAG